MAVTKSHISQLLLKVRDSSFVKNVFVVMFGSALAQLIGFALTPIISRLFNPSDFGIFGSFTAVSSFIAAGVTLEYTQAIVLSKETADAINLFFVSCLVTSVIAAFCLASCLLFPHLLLTIISGSSTWILALLVLVTLANGLNASCQAWCVRVKAFKHTSASQVIRSLSANGSQIGLGYLKAGSAGLIFAAVLAEILASLNLIRVLVSDVKDLRYNIRWHRMKQVAKDYRDFPMYAASQNLMNSLSSGLPVLLLSHFYGIAVAGAYAFGIRIIQAPMGLLLRALRQVLFQKASETYNLGGSLVSLYIRITAGLFALLFPPALLLIIWSPQIFDWIFGSQWQMAGEFVRSLMLWLLFASCNLPAMLFARLIRIQRTIFLYDLVLLAGRASVLVLGGFYLTALNAIMLFSVVGALMNIFLILLVGYALMKKEGQTNWRQIRDCLLER